MLKITDYLQNDANLTVKLEGKLLKPWVDAVRSHVAAIESNSPFLLDLGCLTFADCEGTELLRELLQRGIQVDSCSPYVAELLNWRRGESP